MITELEDMKRRLEILFKREWIEAAALVTEHDEDAEKVREDNSLVFTDDGGNIHVVSHTKGKEKNPVLPKYLGQFSGNTKIELWYFHHVLLLGWIDR